MLGAAVGAAVVAAGAFLIAGLLIPEPCGLGIPWSTKSTSTRLENCLSSAVSSFCWHSATISQIYILTLQVQKVQRQTIPMIDFLF